MLWVSTFISLLITVIWLMPLETCIYLFIKDSQRPKKNIFKDKNIPLTEDKNNLYIQEQNL